MDQKRLHLPEKGTNGIKFLSRDREHDKVKMIVLKPPGE